jgi:hypothetical protein
VARPAPIQWRRLMEDGFIRISDVLIMDFFLFRGELQFNTLRAASDCSIAREDDLD